MSTRKTYFPRAFSAIDRMELIMPSAYHFIHLFLSRGYVSLLLLKRMHVFLEQKGLRLWFVELIHIRPFLLQCNETVAML
jgi:hypothetical protein